MTVLIGFHLPGKGAVLASDGRVTAGTDIMTDACNKTLRCGTVTLAVSGHDGGLMAALAPARDLASVVYLSGQYAKEHTEQHWDLVLYDAESDRLCALLSDGYLQATERAFLTSGCGGSYALGYVEASPKPKSLDTAADLVRAAIKATIRRDSACGGKVRVLTLPRV